jgi:hypothetical protein
MMSTKFMGTCSVNVSKLRAGATRKWFALVDKDGEAAEGLGEVELSIMISSAKLKVAVAKPVTDVTAPVAKAAKKKKNKKKKNGVPQEHLEDAALAQSLAKEIMKLDAAEKHADDKRKVVRTKAQKEADDKKMKQGEEAHEQHKQHKAASKMQSRFRGMKLRSCDTHAEVMAKHVQSRARKACTPKRGYLMKEMGKSKPEKVWCVLYEGIVSCYKSMEDWEQCEREEQEGAPARPKRRQSFSMLSKDAVAPTKTGVFVLLKHTHIAKFTTHGGDDTPMFMLVDKSEETGEEYSQQPTWKLEAADVDDADGWVRVLNQNMALITGKTRPPVPNIIAGVSSAAGGVADRLRPTTITGGIGLAVAGEVAGEVISTGLSVAGDVLGVPILGAVGGALVGAAVDIGTTAFVLNSLCYDQNPARSQCPTWQGYLIKEKQTSSGHSSHRSWCVLQHGIIWEYKSPAAADAAKKKNEKAAAKAAEKVQNTEGDPEPRPRAVSRGRRSIGAPQSHHAEDYFTLNETTHLKLYKDKEGNDTPVFMLTDTSEYEDERQPSWKLEATKMPDNVSAMQGWVALITQSLQLLSPHKTGGFVSAVCNMTGALVMGIGAEMLVESMVGGIAGDILGDLACAAVVGSSLGVGAGAGAAAGVSAGGVVTNTMHESKLARTRCKTMRGSLIKFDSASSSSKSHSVWIVLKHGAISSFNSEEEAAAEAEKYKAAKGATPPAAPKSSPRPMWFRKGERDHKASFLLTGNTKVGVMKTADVEDTSTFMLVDKVSSRSSLHGIMDIQHLHRQLI